MKITVNAILLSLISAGAQAQDSVPVEMADTFRADGKIYVVVGIGLIILVGVAIYLFLIDRKLSVLEKKINKKA